MVPFGRFPGKCGGAGGHHASLWAVKLDLRPGDEFVTGVNYWPRRKAMHGWREFDAAEIRDDLDPVADLGMRVVRIFLLWEDFSRRPSRSRPPRWTTWWRSVTPPPGEASGST